MGVSWVIKHGDSVSEISGKSYGLSDHTYSSSQCFTNGIYTLINSGTSVIGCKVIVNENVVVLSETKLLPNEKKAFAIVPDLYPTHKPSLSDQPSDFPSLTTNPTFKPSVISSDVPSVKPNDQPANNPSKKSNKGKNNKPKNNKRNNNKPKKN